MISKWKEKGPEAQNIVNVAVQAVTVTTVPITEETTSHPTRSIHPTKDLLLLPGTSSTAHQKHI